MPTTLMTPGVYIEEKNAFPGSASAVATAVPVFIGYTEKAERNGTSLRYEPVRINSFAEYVDYFGAGFNPIFTVTEVLKDTTTPDANTDTAKTSLQLMEAVVLNKTNYVIQTKENNTFFLYNSMRLFYANGGSTCYILSVNTYGNNPTLEISLGDFLGTPKLPSVFAILEKEYEPTLIVIPDVIALGTSAYLLYQKVLDHCNKMQSCFGIFDIAYQTKVQNTDDVILAFRNDIGINFLNYGAAYYPWLKTAIVQPSELNFENLDQYLKLDTLLPEADAQKVVVAFNKIEPDKITDSAKKNYHQSLKASSPTYVNILNIICKMVNELPPSAAMAGLYTMVDNSRGVWKAPANVSLNMVTAPVYNITSEAQQNLNVDVMAGKSINVIRPFPGIGTLVWGARTLDGNSQDWRYINVRRTLIMIEQSLKLASRAYVFEPNDSSTWVTVKSMFNNFLFNLWRSGALAGAVPEQAYDVQIGLGATMTPNDILDGMMLISVKVAIVRPAEFIVITFQQKQQES